MNQKDQIGKRAILTRHIKDSNVTAAKIADGAVTPSKLDINGKTDLVTVALAGTVAIGSFPFNAETLTEAAAAYAKVEDGGVFANLAVSGAEAGYTANYQLFPDTEAENDAVYFGHTTTFGVIDMDMSGTAATYGADSLIWEYWNGGGWQPLTILWDETNTTPAASGVRSFMQDGKIFWSAPSDWAQTAIDGQNAYWVRARVNTGFNITQIPITNSVEHKTVSAAAATEMPAAGTIGRTRVSFQTVSGSAADTKGILCNLTKGTASVIQTFTKAVQEHELSTMSVSCDANDQIAWYFTQEEGTTEFANGIMEMNVTKA